MVYCNHGMKSPFYSNSGYSYAEVYGTTYANGDQGNPLQ